MTKALEEIRRSLLQPRPYALAVVDTSSEEEGLEEAPTRLWHEDPALRILVCTTGEAEEHINVRGREEGGYLLLKKPPTRGELSSALRLLLRMWTLEHAVRRETAANRVHQEALQQANNHLEFFAQALADANAKLQDAAIRDPITGLLNRRGMEDRASLCLARCRERGRALIAVFIRCIHFKKLNDSLGYAAGDLALNTIGNNIKALLRHEDHLGRVGGYDFLILLPESSPRVGRLIAERIRAAMRVIQLPVSDDSIQLDAKIAVVSVPSASRSLEEILSPAHLALSKALDPDRGCIVSPESDSEPPVETQRSDLTPILTGERRLRVFCQPIVELETSSVEGFELLIRGPSGPLESPAALFSAALDQNVSNAVDLHCLRHCLAAARRLPGDTLLHINVLPSTLISTPRNEWVDLFRDVSDPRRICMELSEQQAIGDSGALLDTLMTLRRLGVQIALDDVGFGKSCLEVMVLLEPDVIKIDRKAVQGIADSFSQRRALERMVGALRALDTQLIAEGIEDEEDAQCVRSLDIEKAQGYFWGRPRPIGNG